MIGSTSASRMLWAGMWSAVRSSALKQAAYGRAVDLPPANRTLMPPGLIHLARGPVALSAGALRPTCWRCGKDSFLCICWRNRIHDSRGSHDETPFAAYPDTGP